MAVLADSCFLIDLARREAGAMKLAEELSAGKEAVFVPSLVAMEYLAGHKDPEGEASKLRGGAEILPFLEADAVAAARLARKARAEGLFPGWLDLCIAAMAQERDLAIVTRNVKHFRGLDIRSY